jgi:hypothetical protein
MKTKATEPKSVEPAAAVVPSRLARAASAWNRFWFTPVDPTVLGLIRICCGLITFYTFLAYTFDLQELLGEHAWLDLVTRQRQVREGPVYGPLALDWQGGVQLLPRPQEPGPLRDYWDEYVRKWKVSPPAPWPKDPEDAARIDEYHARWGIDPRMIPRQGHPFWSIWFHVTDPDEMMAVQVGFLIASFLFLIGFCTRVTSALTWFAALSYIHRAAATVFGVDTMMTILLLYLMIGPSGAALSVDRLIARWWARARPRVLARWHAFWGRGPGTAATAPASAVVSQTPVPSVSANLAIRLLQVHVCIIYLSAGLSKLQGQSWWTGTAVWGTIANFEFAPMQFDWYNEVLGFIARHRWLFELTMTTAGYFTLFFEIGYAFLIWRPSTRWLMLGMAITLHGFIGVFMGLKTFSLMMLTMNLAFVPPETVRWFVGRVTRRRAGGVPTDAEPAREPGKAVKAAALRQDKEPRQVAGTQTKRRG